MRFVDKAVCHVRKIFPEIYASRTKKGSFHFSMAFSRNKMIAVGINKPDRLDNKAFKIAKRFYLDEKIKWSYLHAEEDMISKLLVNDKLSSSLNIVVLRLNKFGQLGESRPCNNCAEILSAYGLSKIWYSNRDGIICHD